MPVTAWTFLAGTLALIGIFPTSGFWSKEEILMAAYLRHPFVFIILLLAALLTAIYMGRLFSIVFLRNGQKTKDAKDPGLFMKAPLGILAVFSIISGLFLKSFVPASHEVHGPFFVTLLGLLTGTGGFLLTIYFYLFKPGQVQRLAEKFSGPRTVLEKKYYIDEIYDGLIRCGQDTFAHLCDVFERVVIVGLLVNGTAKLTHLAGDFARKIQTGQVQFYALLFSLGVTLLTYGVILWKH